MENMNCAIYNNHFPAFSPLSVDCIVNVFNILPNIVNGSRIFHDMAVPSYGYTR